jgi:hypothetical protein
LYKLADTTKESDPQRDRRGESSPHQAKHNVAARHNVTAVVHNTQALLRGSDHNNATSELSSVGVKGGVDRNHNRNRNRNRNQKPKSDVPIRPTHTVDRTSSRSRRQGEATCLTCLVDTKCFFMEHTTDKGDATLGSGRSTRFDGVSIFTPEV